MGLSKEISEAKHDIVTDGYDMSIGEIMNLYRDEELIINPNFQRYFVWGESQKTRFIESIILGIPIPSIFVYQNEDGIWELVDGLQRLSTIFEFAGILRTPEGEIANPSVLDGTQMLPSLAGRSWLPIEIEGTETLTQEHKLELKRSRMRVEILKKESDTNAKFELFQRLNTGGTQLKPQEVRNAVMVMIDKNFYDWLHSVARNPDFIHCIDPSEKQEERQFPVELTLRFFVYRNVPYEGGLDVHEYIDSAMIDLATRGDFDQEAEKAVFSRTFRYLRSALDRPFRRWDGESFSGRFLISAYEAIAYGVSENIEDLDEMGRSQRDNFLETRVKEMWEDEVYQSNSGAGVRGTTRLRNLLPEAPKYFSRSS